MVIGDRIRSERERLEMSQTRFAKVAGTTKQTLFSWETGKTFPNAAQMASLDEAGVDVLFIVTGRREMTNPKAPEIARDCDRLAIAIEAVNEGLSEARKKLPPRKLAELILTAYELIADPVQSRDNVIKLVRMVAQGDLVMRDEKPEDKIKRLIKESSTDTNVTDFFEAARKRGKAIKSTPPVMQITGNNNTGVVGNNNKVEINIKNASGKAPKVELRPGPEHISDAQASEIRDLVNKVVIVSGGTHSFVWSTLKTKYRFTRYQLITHDKYEDIRKYLRKWIKSKSPSVSAARPKPLKNRLLARIHAEAKKEGLLDEIKAFVHGRFGTSMSELSPGQLKEVIQQFRL